STAYRRNAASGCGWLSGGFCSSLIDKWSAARACAAPIGKESILNSTKKALIAAVVAILFAGALIVWQVKARKAGPVELTPEDMALIAEDQPPQMRARLAADEAARKDFAQDVRRLLAVAEEAEKNGVGNEPDMKRQLEFQKASVVAQEYFKAQGEQGTGDIKDAEVDEF